MFSTLRPSHNGAYFQQLGGVILVHLAASDSRWLAMLNRGVRGVWKSAIKASRSNSVRTSRFLRLRLWQRNR
jgi:hypothetical protein